MDDSSTNFTGANRDIYPKSHGEFARADWDRVKLFASICARIDGVVAAEPIWMNEAEGVIGYKKISDLLPCLRHARLDATMFKIGATLASIHMCTVEEGLRDSLIFPIEMLVAEQATVRVLRENFPVGFVHGDFWHGNVFSVKNDKLAILDPLPNWHILGMKNFVGGSGCIDLSMMYMSIFFCHPLRKLMFVNPRKLLIAANALLDGYFFATGCSSAREAALSLARTLAVRHIASYKTRLARPIAMMKTPIAHKLLERVDKETGWND